MRILITSQGSTGDIIPMIAIGNALQTQGHQIIFATFPGFRQTVEKAGLEFCSLPPHWELDELKEIMRSLLQLGHPIRQLNELYRRAAPHLSAQLETLYPLILKADLIVSSYLFPLNQFLPERPNKPFAAVAFAHNTIPREDTPPHGCPRLGFLPGKLASLYNQGMWKAANRTMDFLLTRILRRHGADPTVKIRDFFFAPSDRVLVAVSPQLCAPSAIPGDRFKVVGYCRWQDEENPYLERELTHFTGGEKIPVLTLGSMVYENPGKTIRQLISHWPSHRKLMVQAGWAGFGVSDPPSNVKFIPPCNHDQLFRHADVIFHHGGAGTTGSALYAGKPQIIIPHIADQKFFGAEMQRLGVGKVLPRQQWIRQLFATYQKMVADSETAHRARQMGERLSQENGADEAARQLIRFAEDFSTT